MDLEIRGSPAVGRDDRDERVAGDVALDFVNSASWDVQGPLSDRLVRYRDLVRFARGVGHLSANDAAVLLEESEREREVAAAELERALRARRLLRDVFHALSRRHEPRPADLDALSAEFSQAFATSSLEWRDGAIVRRWAASPLDLGQVIRPILAAAAELLLGERVSRLRQCAGERCGWLFLDESRNGMRRWCDMRVCGSREKARRYYDRKRGD